MATLRQRLDRLERERAKRCDGQWRGGPVMVQADGGGWVELTAEEYRKYRAENPGDHIIIHEYKTAEDMEAHKRIRRERRKEADGIIEDG